jgi:UDP-N-acetyl-2-amino-2-deoxyglucuronate dehydrogenase
MKKKINFAVIGCGHIGKRHAAMIVRNEGAKLVALADIKSKDNLDINEFNVPFFQSIEDLIKSDLDIDVINIATPNGFHAEQAIIALNNKKHVVIEKPIALSKNDAENILYKALNANRQVFAVMQNRYSPPSTWIKKVVEDQILGQIYLVQLNCYWNRDKRYYTKGSWHGKKNLDGGTLFTQFSHFIDIVYWLFGDIDNIKSKFFNFNHSNLTEFEDSGFITFDFIKGGNGILNYSTSVWDKNLESSMTIIAEKGTVKIGGQYMDKVEYCHIDGYTLPVLPPTNPGNDYGAYKGSAQNHNYIIDNVVNVLNNQANITTNALEGMKVVDIIERIYNS